MIDKNSILFLCIVYSFIFAGITDVHNFIFCSIPVNQNIYTLDTHGRSIQVDAFLIEWKTKNVKKINGKIPFFWDAITTSQGVVGYFRFPVNDSCENIVVDIHTSLYKAKQSFSIHIDTITAPQNFYALESVDNEEGKSMITEWIIPWDSIPADTTGKYEIGFFIHNACGDTNAPVVFKGAKSTGAHTSIYTKQIIIQIISIAVLLSIFIFLKKRIKFRLRQSGQKQ